MPQPVARASYQVRTGEAILEHYGMAWIRSGGVGGRVCAILGGDHRGRGGGEEAVVTATGVENVALAPSQGHERPRGRATWEEL
jgi:hypothetical protein